MLGTGTGTGGGVGFEAGSGVGIAETLGTLDGTGTDEIAGVGGTTASKRPGGAGATGFACITRGGSALTRGAVGWVGRLVAGITVVAGLLPKMRPMIPGFFSSIGAAGAEASAAGVRGVATGSRLNERPPINFLSRGSWVGAGAATFGGELGASAKELIGTFTGTTGFKAMGGITGTYGFALTGIGFALTGGSGAGNAGRAGAGSGIPTGFGSGGRAVTGGGTGTAGATAAGTFTLLPGAGSTSVNVSPFFGSFTSVSTLPSGFFVAFTIVTIRSA